MSSTIIAILFMTACGDVADDLAIDDSPGEPAAEDIDGEPDADPDLADDVDEPEPEPEPTTQSPVDDGQDGRVEYELAGDTSWDEAGVHLEVDRIAFVTRARLLEAEPDAEFLLDDATNTLVSVRVAARNETGATLAWYPDQGTLVIGSEQRDAAIFLSGDVGDTSWFDGVAKQDTVVWEFRGDFHDLVESGHARYVVSGASDADSFDRVTGDADLSVTWSP